MHLSAWDLWHLALVLWSVAATLLLAGLVLGLLAGRVTATPRRRPRPPRRAPLRRR